MQIELNKNFVCLFFLEVFLNGFCRQDVSLNKDKLSLGANIMKNKEKRNYKQTDKPENNRQIRRKKHINTERRTGRQNWKVCKITQLGKLIHRYASVLKKMK